MSQDANAASRKATGNHNGVDKAKACIDERIRLVQAIWDSIAAEQAYPDLTVDQRQELERRIAAYEVMTWEEIKASIKGQQ